MMQLKFFQVLMNDESSHQALEQFLKQHRIVSMEKEFVQNGEQSFWAICLTYQMNRHTVSSPSSSQAVTKKPQIDYKDVLTPEEFAKAKEMVDETS